MNRSGLEGWICLKIKVDCTALTLSSQDEQPFSFLFSAIHPSSLWPGLANCPAAEIPPKDLSTENFLQPKDPPLSLAVLWNGCTFHYPFQLPNQTKSVFTFLLKNTLCLLFILHERVIPFSLSCFSLTFSTTLKNTCFPQLNLISTGFIGIPFF